MQILVADGMSDDRTREIVEAYAEREPAVSLLDNPKRTMPAGVNVALEVADGETIVVLGSHATYEGGYLATLAGALEEFGADCAGGVLQLHTLGNRPFSRASMLAQSHSFGVGNATYKTGATEPIWVDTAGFPVCRREVFDRVGKFNEALVHSQDMEFWLRVRKAGFSILLHPGAQAHFYTLDGVRASTRYFIRNGFWVTWPWRLTGLRPRWRHAVPGISVSAGVLLLAAGLATVWAWYLLLALVVTYGASATAISVGAAIRRRDWWLAPMGPVVFALLHVTYGFASLWGLIKPMSSEHRRQAQATTASARPRG